MIVRWDQTSSTFNEEMLPRLKLTIGTESRLAYYTGEVVGRGADGYGGMNSLLFEYVVQGRDKDANGISIPANALEQPGEFIIQHAYSEVASPVHALQAILSHPAVPDDFDHRVSGDNDSLSSLSLRIIGSGPTYVCGDIVNVITFLNTGEKISRVEGTPELTLTIGTQMRQARYASTIGGNSFFNYRVQAGDRDDNGISIPANALSLNGGTIFVNDVALDTELLGNAAVDDDRNHRVRGDCLTISGLDDATVDENMAYTVTPTVSNAIGNVTWSIEGNDVDDFTIDASTGVLSMAAQNFEAPADANSGNDYEVTVQATDDDGNTATESITVTVRDVEEMATFTIGGIADATVEENSVYGPVTPTLTGMPIGNVTWSIEGDDVDDFTIDASTGVLSMAAQNFEAPADTNSGNDYEVTVQATDDDGNTATESITVTVQDVEEETTFTIGGIADAMVEENSVYGPVTPTLTGMPIGNVTWSIEGNDVDDFTIDASTGMLSMAAQNFEAPADANNDNDYEVTVQATDDDGNTATESITVTVRNVMETRMLTLNPPVNTMVDENAAYSEVLTLTGNPSGRVRWRLEGDNAPLFSLTAAANGRSATLELGPQDFENPQGGPANDSNTYLVRVSVTDDDGNTANQDITVTVRNVMETRMLTLNPPANTMVDENATYSQMVTLTGNPSGGVDWTLEGEDASLFSLIAAQDGLSATLEMGPQDFENPQDGPANDSNTYLVRVSVTDDDGNTANQDITVTVRNVMETRMLTLNPPANTMVDENATYSEVLTLTGNPSGRVRWRLEGDNVPLFSLTAAQDGLSATLELGPQDFENPQGGPDNDSNIYLVRVSVTDDDGSTADQDIAVMVRDVMETRVLTVNPPVNTIVDENATYSEVLTLSGDPIGKVRWHLEGDNAPLFSLTAAANGRSATLELGPQDFENPQGGPDNDSNIYLVRVSVTDDDGNAADQDITVTVRDVREAEVLTVNSPANTMVDENATYSETVTLMGNPSGGVDWTLEGEDASLFSLTAAANGRSATLELEPQDFENPQGGPNNNSNVYLVRVKAIDQDNNTADQDIAVTVRDVRETRVLTVNPPANTTVDENATYSETVTLAGRPIGGVDWTLEGEDASLFSLTAAQDGLSATLELGPQDFENPQGGLANDSNDYLVTVRVTDDDGNTADQDITVTVRDVTENVMLTVDPPANTEVLENRTYSEVVTLSGDPIGTVRWQLEGDNAPLFSLTAAANGRSATLELGPQDFENPQGGPDNNSNVYLVTVKVIDDDSNTATEGMTVTVRDAEENAMPIVNPPANTEVLENRTYSEVVTLTGDPISGVSWELEGENASLFSLTVAQNGLSAILKLGPQDFENPQGGPNNDSNDYLVTVKITDGDNNTADQDITVTVRDVIETRMLTVSPPETTAVDENATYSQTITLTGNPIGGVDWKLGGEDASLFSLTAAQDGLSATLELGPQDFENPQGGPANDSNGYLVTVNVTDDDDNTADQNITVTVRNVIETKVLTVNPPVNTIVDENATYSEVLTLMGGPSGGVDWSLEGEDALLFSLTAAANGRSATLELEPQDFENPQGGPDNDSNDYLVTVRVTDDDGNTADQSITVTVRNVIETKVLTVNPPETTAVDENITYSEVLTLMGSPSGGVDWTLEGEDASLFSLTAAANGRSATLELEPQDFENPQGGPDNNSNVYLVRVKATDQDNNTADQDITVTVRDVGETEVLTVNPPENTIVDENATYSETITLTGNPIGRVDWKLGGEDASLFSLTAAQDGLSATLELEPQDFENPQGGPDNDSNDYLVTVNVTDDDDNTADQDITVMVRNVIETTVLTVNPPVNTIVDENAAYSEVLTLTGSPRGGVDWSLEGEDALLFSLTAAANGRSATLELEPQDFENPQGGPDNDSNDYLVTVRVTDDDGNTADQSITVTVRDVRETAALSSIGLAAEDVQDIAERSIGDLVNAMVSVADAEAFEDSDAALEFTITLSQAGNEEIRVDYATTNGTATAGADYIATSGILIFAPGETHKTVSVPLLDDSHDDDGETFSLTLSNPSPSSVQLDRATATGTIRNADTAQQAWMLRFGRTMAEHLLDGVQQRLQQPLEPGVQLTMAGEQLLEGIPLEEQHGILATALGFTPTSGQQVLEGTSFALTPGQDMGADGAARLSFWGEGALSSFSGQQDGLSLSGEVSTALLGLDWHQPRWRAGAALAHSWATGSSTTEHDRGDGNGAAETDISSTLTGLFPYGGYALHPRLWLWGMAGYGWGQLSLTPEGDETTETSTNLSMAALGLEGILLDGGAEGLTVSTRLDGLLLETTSAETTGLQASQGSLSRLRWGLEAVRSFPLANGSAFTPSLEIGLRQDGGDAETGSGLELATALSWTAPQQGISASLRGRTILSHADEDFHAQGMAVAVSWDPFPDSERGVSLSLGHSLGTSTSDGMDALLSSATLEKFHSSISQEESRFETTLAYGFPAFSDRFTLSPHVGLALSPDSSTYKLGMGLSPFPQQQDPSLSLTLEGERQESTSSGSAAEHSTRFRFSLLF